MGRLSAVAKAAAIQAAQSGIPVGTVAAQYSVTEGTVRKWLRESSEISEAAPNVPVAAGDITPPDERRGDFTGEADTFVLTCAQNNTLVHEGFLNALLTYCNNRNARLIVGTVTYNKSGFQNGTKDDDGLWYDPRVQQYIVDGSVKLADDLVWCGELDILPTEVRPLSGFGNYTRAASGIVPHTKLQMQSIPTLPGGFKAMYTTGAVTLRNYIQRKTGQKAEFHHVHGAVVVEIDRSTGQWWVRQLVAERDGSFYDLTSRYSPDGTVQEGCRVAAINWGDVHAEKCNLYKTVLGMSNSSMLDVLRPQWQFMHDLLDFTSRNHHNMSSGHFMAAMGDRSVHGDLLAAADVLWEAGRPFCTTVVVESNHDLALARWLDDTRGHTDPINSKLWHTLNVAHLSGKRGLRYAIDLCGDYSPDGIVFLREDESFVICRDSGGIECGMHGHRGPNGRRGSPAAFRDVGIRVNIGHTHSAEIIDGVYCAGVTGDFDMGYNKGPSSWSRSHIVTYQNGKRTIVRMQGDECRWRR